MGEMSTMLVMFAAMFGLMYFFMLRPQNKERATYETLLSSLKKGDSVVLTSGILGTVDAVESQTIDVEIAKGIKIKALKSAVSMQSTQLDQKTGQLKSKTNTEITAATAK